MAIALPPREQLVPPGTVTAVAAMAAGAVGVVVVSRSAAVAAVVLGLLILASVVVWLSRGRDAVTVALGFTILLFGLQAQYVVGPLGALGSPARLLALGAAVLWGLTLVVPATRDHIRTHGLHVALGAYVVMTLVAYAVAHRHQLSSIQVNAADRALLTAVGMAGLALLIADGTRSRQRLDFLLQGIVLAGGFLGLVSVLQYLDIYDVTAIQVPGLTLNGDLVSVANRSGFNRVAGTTLHPIECGIVLVMILPIGLHYAMWSATPLARKVMWGATGLCFVALPMTVSRTAFVGLAVMGIVLLPGWSRRLQFRMAIVGGVALVAMRLAFPGLLGTIKSLFLSFGQDDSISGRTNDYEIVFRFIHDFPWLGQGLATFLPEEYFYLDNQFLGTLLEEGVIGLVIVLIVPIVAACAARRAGDFSGDPETASLGRAMRAILWTGVTSFITFDALGFPVFTGLFFLVIGACGALSRLERDRRAALGLADVPRRNGRPFSFNPRVDGVLAAR